MSSSKKSKSKSKKGKRSIKKKTNTRTKYSKNGGSDANYMLHEAVADASVDEIRYWISRGADINSTNPMNDYTPLMTAVEMRYNDIAEVLLTYDDVPADVNASDDPTGTTSLMIACKNVDVYMIEMLLYFGADKSMKNNYQQTALSLLFAFEPHGVIADNIGKRLRILRTLANPEMGEGVFEVDSQDDSEYTPLMTIVGTSQQSPYINEVEPIVDALLSYGADAMRVNSNGTTAYDIAVRYGQNASILEKLRPAMLDVPIPMMNPEDYQDCDKEDGIIIDHISYEPLSNERAVKLEDSTHYCYDRENLRTWIQRHRTNPITRTRITPEWIQTNYPRGINRSHEINANTANTTGGKRKKTLSKRRKNKKKSRKL